MTVIIGRRELLVALGGAVAAWPLATRAQQQGRSPRIGIIDDTPMWDAFRQGLRDLGYLEGQNIAFEYRRADGAPERRVGRSTRTFCSPSLPTSKSTGRPRLKRCVSNSPRRT